MVVGMPVSGLPSDFWIALARAWSSSVNCGAPIRRMLSYTSSAPALLASRFQVAEWNLCTSRVWLAWAAALAQSTILS
ncbi:hypothetical protein SCANM63S_03373 [Streptomyces canarius]